MFAILKFQQRSNAATFSHAFVLTINLKYPTVKEADAGTTFKDLNVSLDTKEKITGDASESLNATAAEVHVVDAEFQDNINENKSKNCNIKTCEENKDQDATADVKEQSLKSTKKTDKISIEKLDDGNEERKSIAVQKSNQEMQNSRRYKIFSSLESGMIKDDVAKWTLSNGFGFYEDSMEKSTCPLNDKNVSDDRKMINETIVDSDNVPDQYFIEKEIQGNKRSNSSFSTISQPLPKDFRAEMRSINEHSTLEAIERSNNESVRTKLKEHNNKLTKTDLKFEDNKQHTATSIIIDDNLSTNNTYKSYKSRKQKGREFERRTIFDDKVLRSSSNITDLVMEGLMFTIRQDQDSVAVIEQKTKLEMDEVLENSEKVETKAGEKCLLNSSLLKLENLVTMIDSPREQNEQQHKTCHAISNNTCLSSFNNFSSTVYNLDVDNIDEEMDKLNIPINYDKHNVKDYLNPCESRWQNKYISSNIKNNDCSSRGMITERNKFMKQQDENNREDRNNIEAEEEERKDFIPQAFQNGDLLTGNRDVEEANKHEMSAKKFYNSPSSSFSSRRMFAKEENFISEESASIELAQQEANGPRIISNKTITIEQMSPALQKVLRHTRRLSSTSNSETFQCEQKTRHMSSTEDAFPETAISFKDNDTSSNTSSVELGADSEEIKAHQRESRLINKDTPEIIEDTKIYDNEECAREKSNESNRSSRRNSSSKNGSPRKLQDITEDFYYDLLHVRNKDNAIRQRCLRRKQRSLNDSDNIKNGKVRIEMLKFIQDITEGARVVVRRLNIDNKSSLERGSM